MFKLVLFLHICLYILLPYILVFQYLIALIQFYLISCIHCLSSVELIDYFYACYTYGFRFIMFQYILDKLFKSNSDY